MNVLMSLLLLANLNPVDGIRGTVLASPSKTDPDYYYHWVRDASVVMGVVDAQKLGDTDTLMKGFVEATKYQQEASGDQNLGEPKYLVSGEPYTGPWGRPQNDGPALRAITLIKFAHRLLDAKQGAYVKSELYDGKFPSRSIIKRDLEYVSHRWNEPCFDLWEEAKGQHFYTLSVSARALREGAVLADRLKDPGAADFYRAQEKLIVSELQKFVTVAGEILPTRKWEAGLQKPAGIDTAVVLGLLHSDFLFAPPNDARVVKTLEHLEAVFRDLYAVNAKGPGIAIGRYPEDTYYGGNPWFLTTAAVGELYYRRAIQVFSEGNMVLARQLQSRGEAFFSRILFHMPQDKRLTEQFDADQGTVLGAADLTWSYASLLTLLQARAEASTLLSMETLPAVATSFTDHCTKCDAERYHRVLAHVDEKSAKVQCEICGKKRTFKLKSAKPKRAGVVRKAKASQPAMKKLEWQKMNEERGKDTPHSYSIQNKFSAKDKIQHAKFGVGFVTAVVGDRLTVIFEDGEKTLVHKK